MQLKIDKKRILKAMEGLPENATVGQAMYKLYVLSKISKALADPNRYTHEEVKEHFSKRSKQQANLDNQEEVISKPRGPFVTEVESVDAYWLHLTFENGEQRILDMTPYMIGVFVELKNPEYFRRVRVVHGSIAWSHGQDLASDMLYKSSHSLDPQE